MRKNTDINRITTACGRHLKDLGAKRILGRFVLGLVATLAISGVGHAMLHPTSAENDDAVKIISEMTHGEVVTTSLPQGFEQSVGYLPDDTAGLLIDPHGGCSTPGGVGPGRFDTACRVHDFGYDVLRFAEDDGHRLGAWARAEIDILFYEDLLETCEDVACQVTATVYYTAVSANSIRQGFKAPTDEPTVPWVIIWLAVVAVAVVPSAGALAARKIRWSAMGLMLSRWMPPIVRTSPRISFLRLVQVFVATAHVRKLAVVPGADWPATSFLLPPPPGISGGWP